ncbi:MAG: glycosyltransferase family 8 protein [Helicobacter sp.]|nr:glycosyltransferase family 8 protein [Helicobacter sp.]
MFPIVFNADENYIKFSAVLITSIVKNTNLSKSFKELCKQNPKNFIEKYEHLNYDSLSKKEQKEGYIFHILSNFVSDETRKKLEKLCEELSLIYPCEIRIHIIDEKEFEGFPRSGAAHKNYLPYYRLKAFDFIKDLQKCLYLDSDMLCLCDIRELFAIDLKDKFVACVGDSGSKRRKIKFKENGEEKIFYYDKNYFNSGFLLINTHAYETVCEQCQSLAKQITYTKTADQNLLNAIIKKEQQLKLPFAYNFVTHAFCYVICKDEDKNRLNYTREEFSKSAKEPKILHLGYKPWKFLRSFSDLSGKDVGEYWWDMALQTPAFKEELLELREQIKDYSKEYTSLGLSALDALKSWNCLKIHHLIKDKNSGKELSNEVDKLDGSTYGLCILLAEVIEHARNRNKSSFGAILKLAKILYHFKKYGIR